MINLSNVQLSEHQVRALEKGLTFGPTPGHPDKSRIWDDLKEFHRRLELFSNTKYNSEIDMPQSIMDFMNENAKLSDQADPPSDPYKAIHSKIKN